MLLSLNTVLKEHSIRERTKIVKKILNDIFNKKIIYLSNYISTAIVEDEELKIKIKEIIEIFKDDKSIMIKYEEMVETETICFEYSKNKNKVEKLKIMENELINFTKNQDNKEGRLYYYKYDIMEYYNENMYIIEIGNKGDSEPQTAYSGISSYNNEFNDEEKTLFKPLYYSGKEKLINKKLLSIIIMENIKKNKILVKEKHIYTICTIDELKKIEEDIEYMKSNKLLEVNNKSIDNIIKYYKDNAEIIKELLKKTK